VEEILLKQRMASGVFGFEHATPRQPTKQEKQIERYRNVMENLHSQSNLNNLLRTGNAMNDVPAPVRRALAEAGSSEEISSDVELLTGTYIVHNEKVRLPNGSICIWSLHVRLEFIRETVETSTRGNVKTTTTIRYYRLIVEWKAQAWTQWCNKIQAQVPHAESNDKQKNADRGNNAESNGKQKNADRGNNGEGNGQS